MPNPWRSGEKGVRPPRIANCSGYHGDDPEEMLKQATKGDVDFITGDYLAEVNMAGNAEAHARGDHPGYEQTAWMGIQQSISVINENKIKIAINGGALNPEGLARKVESKGYDLKVAYVSGDNVLSKVSKIMPGSEEECLPHLDSDNKHVCPSRETYLFTRMQDRPEIVSANAYTGARAIVKALEEGADIIICGRASDASPVIAAAWYWWGWSASDYDALAGALVAGHLIECSAYVTGGNFAGFDRYDIEHFVDPGFPIAEIAKDGSCVITKHPNTGGMVNIDTCKSQLLYELQGNIYLNSDVKAYLDDIEIEEIGKDRVQVRGARGAPPPPTTKLAIFYKGGYEMQILMNATGYAFERKFELLKRQIEHFVGKENLDKLDVFDLQCLGTPAPDPRNQNESTVYFRVFAQAGDIATLSLLGKSFLKISLKHFHGYHSSLDGRTAIPRPYLAYYPALWPQSEIDEAVHFVNRDGNLSSIPCAPLGKSEPLEQRVSYDTSDPVEFTGPFRKVRLGDVALARSGDKGANLNFGIYVDRKEKWDWLRTYLSRARVSSMLEADMQPDYTIERVEFPKLYAVHFVVYGILGRGVSSSKRLDGFGKGFADYFRDKLVDYPESLVALEHQPQPSL